MPIFGICCEPLSKQVTYPIDEACNTGKGADTVISYLHHFFEVHAREEKKLLLHADIDRIKNMLLCITCLGVLSLQDTREYIFHSCYQDILSLHQIDFWAL